MSLVKVENLSFSYSPESKKAVEDISFSIEKGQYAVILGTNGSGKSTLSKIICGFLQATSGKVTIEEGCRTGIVFQYPKDQIVSGIVARDTEFGPENLGLSKSEIEQRVIESLAVTGLLDRAESKTNALSLGQTQKLALSGILALRPDLLVLDEATSMLDPASRKEILEYLDYSHKHGQTILHITHDLDEALKADHVIMMKDGKKTFDGSATAFRASEILHSLFGSPLNVALPAGTGKSALKVSDIHFSYEERNVLRGINFELEEGTINAITGESGAGKSTLLEILAGLQIPQAGKIYSKTRPVLALQDAEAAIYEKYAADDVAFGPSNLGVHGKELKARVVDCMNLVNLPFDKFADRQTFLLSGGEKRKLSIAGIIAMDSPVILFDEPTAGLDFPSRQAFFATLRKLAAQGKTILFSTHRMEEAKSADRHLTLRHGIITEDTRPFVSRDKNSSESELPQIHPLEGAKFLQSIKKTADFSGDGSKKDSILSKIPSWGKYLIFFALFGLSLCLPNIYFTAALAFATILYALLGKYSVKRLFTTFMPLIPWLLFFAILELIFFPVGEGEKILWQNSWMIVSDFKAMVCVRMFIRTFAALAAIRVFVYTTSEKEMLDGVAAVLSPLKKLHVPYRPLVVIFEIIFRFIPLLIEEAESIVKTQLVRGGLKKTKGPIAKLKIILPLFVPLIIQTIKRSEALADALTARYF